MIICCLSYANIYLLCYSDAKISDNCNLSELYKPCLSVANRCAVIASDKILNSLIYY